MSANETLLSNAAAYELRFECLNPDGRRFVCPCDVGGDVDLDGLSERVRIGYLGARALVGCEYASPVVTPR